LDLNAQIKVPSANKIGKSLKSKAIPDTLKKAAKIKIPPTSMKLKDIPKTVNKTKGILGKVIQPIKFKQNRENKERARMYLFMQQLISNGQLKIDSTTVEQIMIQLDTINSSLLHSASKNNSENKAINKRISDIIETNNLDKKASESVIESLKIMMSAVIQESINKNNQDKRDLGIEINNTLKEIKKVQHSCVSNVVSEVDSLIENETIRFFKRCLNPKIKVYGWHSSMLKDEYKNYNYNYLSAINLDCFELSAEGTCNNPEALLEFEKAGGVIKLAQSKGCDVHLTIYNNNASDIQDFLWSNLARKTFYAGLDTLIKNNSLKGVNIFFDNTMKPELFVSFIRELSQNLKSIDKSILLNISIPAITDDNSKIRIESYDFQSLSELVDFYLVMTDNMLPQYPEYAQSPSPLYTKAKYGNHSIESTIGFYTNIGIPVKKLVMTVSYSGYEWQVFDFQGALMTQESNLYSYNEILEKYYEGEKNALTIVEDFDPDQVSAFYNISGFNPDEKKQIWFEDFRSLYTKYNWAVDQGLAGVSIRGLGNDDGYSELWDVIGASLIKIDTNYLAHPESEKSSYRKFWSILTNAVNGFSLNTFRQDLKWARVVRLKYYTSDTIVGYRRVDPRLNKSIEFIDDSISKYLIKEKIWSDTIRYVEVKKNNFEGYLPSLPYCYSLYARWTIYAQFFKWCFFLMLVLTILFAFISFNLERYQPLNIKSRIIFRNLTSGIGFIAVLFFCFWMFIDPSIKWTGTGSLNGTESIVMIYLLIFGIVFGWFCTYNYYKFKKL